MNLEAMSREELARELERLLEQEQEQDQDQGRLIHDLEVHQVELELQNRELREAQSALEESRSRFEELYDFAPIAYYTFDPQGVVQEVNLTGATMVGRDRAEVIGMPFVALVKMASVGALWNHLRRCAGAQRPVVTEMRFTVERGGSRVVQVVSAPVFDRTGRPIAFRTSFTDISKLKHIEAELERSHDEETCLRKRFENLDRASLALGQVLAQAGAMREEVLLQLIVDEARRIADAEFAAIGIGIDSGRAFEPCVYSGMDPAGAAAVGRHPRPRGLLGRSGADRTSISPARPSRAPGVRRFSGPPSRDAELPRHADPGRRSGRRKPLPDQQVLRRGVQRRRPARHRDERGRRRRTRRRVRDGDRHLGRGRRRWGSGPRQSGQRADHAVPADDARGRRRQEPGHPRWQALQPRGRPDRGDGRGAGRRHRRLRVRAREPDRSPDRRPADRRSPSVSRWPPAAASMRSKAPCGRSCTPNSLDCPSSGTKRSRVG